MTHTLSRNPLDQGSARERDLNVRTHNIYIIRTSMLLAGFEPAISGSERPQIYAIELPATEMGYIHVLFYYLKLISWRLF
jgi:hypothetical protein